MVMKSLSIGRTLMKSTHHCRITHSVFFHTVHRYKIVCYSRSQYYGGIPGTRELKLIMLSDLETKAILNAY